MKSKHSTAIIFFSRHARKEGLSKAWFGMQSVEKNQQLAVVLEKHCSDVVQEIGLPVFHFHEENQIGTTFGEKLANAYQTVFDLGYTSAISVGNDTPEISEINWIAIEAALDNRQNCIGPSTRGGAYLIGLTADSFDKDEFAQLPWQQTTLYTHLEDYCSSKASSVMILNTFRDINTYFDVVKWVQTTRQHLAETVLQIMKIGLVAVTAQLSNRIYGVIHNLNLPSRAPPLFG